MSWEYKKMDDSILLNKNLAKPGITYDCIFNLLEYYNMVFVSKIPYLADLGIFRVDSLDLKNILVD